MKKIMVVLLVAMVGVAFGGKFEISEYNRLVKAKDFAGLKTYLTTNSEYNDNNKQFFTQAQLVVKGRVDKTITKANILSAIHEACVANKLDANGEANILLAARFIVPEINFIQTSNYIIEFYKNNQGKITAKNPIFYAYYWIKNNDKMIEVVKSMKLVPKVIQNNFYGNKFTVQQAVEIVKMISENPAKYISTANSLSKVVDIIKQCNDPKYDEIVKTALVKINRVFYSKITESDDWKQAVVKLNLVIKSYGL